ncbi:CopG family transcriptional regulator [Amycolatopsis anabasis]|uniref:CopG family transcriptional regulator n=1 Tax=Amycolatopsis anabasis TaxID=1840409 RepID=UPI00131BA6DF|nr:CopG family transcriptional regulator [Amycolatopsis anabasis]
MGDGEAKQFNVHLPVRLIKQVKHRAIETGLSADALRAYLDDAHGQRQHSSKEEALHGD